MHIFQNYRLPKFPVKFSHYCSSSCAVRAIYTLGRDSLYNILRPTLSATVQDLLLQTSHLFDCSPFKIRMTEKVWSSYTQALQIYWTLVLSPSLSCAWAFFWSNNLLVCRAKFCWIQLILVHWHLINWNSATKKEQNRFYEGPFLQSLIKNWFVPLFVNYEKKNRNLEVPLYTCAL